MIPLKNSRNAISGICIMLLTASTSPKLSLAPLITKLFAVKKRPERNAMILPTI